MGLGRCRGGVVVRVIALAFLVSVAIPVAPCRAQTTVFIVRHAEKGGMPVSNPPLTEAGKKRANELAQMLRSVRLTVVLTSEFERTIETARPTAEAKNLEITRHRARDVPGLVKRIMTKYQGGTLLVSGHSDTIPVLFTQLGVERAEVPEIAHDEYDNLFVLFIAKGGEVTLQRLRYGAPSEVKASGSSTPDAAPQPKGE